jgi:hypothetical protein
MKRGVCILWMVMAWLQTVCAGEWQWAVTLKGFVSDETKKEPEAFLWVPAHCERLSAVMWGQQNMTEEMLFDMPSFRDSLAEMGVGLIWIAPGIDQQWDVRKGTQKVFDQMINDLAEVSGYTELREVPLIPFGHSAMATFPWNFAAWNSDRTLAVVSFHGDAPRTNLCGYGRENLEWGRTRNIDGIPGLKAAYAEESFYVGADQLDALVSIKSKNEVIAEIVALLQSPAKNVISALQSGGNTIHGVLKTLGERAE